MSYKVIFSHFIGITVSETFTAVIYMSNIPQEKLFNFISGGLIHDTAFVYEVMSKDCEYVKQNCQHIKKLSIFLIIVHPSIKITKVS